MDNEIRDQKFWAKVQKTNSCWLYIGATHNGYGWLTRGNKQLNASRYSWQLHFGAIPDGLWVLHKCDVTPVRQSLPLIYRHTGRQCSRHGSQK